MFERLQDSPHEFGGSARDHHCSKVTSKPACFICCEATRRCILLHRSEDVLRAPAILYIQLAAYCSTAIFFDNIDAGHILSRKLARREEKARDTRFLARDTRFLARCGT